MEILGFTESINCTCSGARGYNTSGQMLKGNRLGNSSGLYTRSAGMLLTVDIHSHPHSHIRAP